MDTKEALRLLLDHIDWEAGNCRINEMIGAILPHKILILAKDTIKQADKLDTEISKVGGADGNN